MRRRRRQHAVVQMKTAQIKQQAQIHLAMRQPVLPGGKVDARQPRAQGRQRLLIHQIALGHQHPVGKANLPAHHGMLGQLRRRVQRIHHGNHPIQPIGLNQRVAGKKCLGDWRGVGQPGGFDHQAVKRQLPRRPPGVQIAQMPVQVTANGAAQTAIGHLDHFAGFVDQQGAVDIHRAKLVFDHGNFLPMRAAQNVIEQGGFARAKKTGKQSDWNRIHASSATRQKENPAMMRGESRHRR
jgi:hypothetical protein